MGQRERDPDNTIDVPLASLVDTSRPRRSLASIFVASPCPAMWDEMHGDERVRFCSRCMLNVYNLSEMTRQEADDVISSKEAHLCVRY